MALGLLSDYHLCDWVAGGSWFFCASLTACITVCTSSNLYSCVHIIMATKVSLHAILLIGAKEPLNDDSPHHQEQVA